MANCTQIAKETIGILTVAAPYLINVGQQLGMDAVNKAKQLFAMVRDRFRQDDNGKAERTLDLFLENTDTFQSALSKFLQQTLTQHPDWANDVQRVLADGALQTIIVANQGEVKDVDMKMQGAGEQRIEADDRSTVQGIKMNINNR